MIIFVSPLKVKSFRLPISVSTHKKKIRNIQFLTYKTEYRTKWCIFPVYDVTRKWLPTFKICRS